jgi:hypothetical protein
LSETNNLKKRKRRLNMRKNCTVVFLSVLFLLLLVSNQGMAEIGRVTAKSSDVDISIFGHLKTNPHFISNADFNDDNTSMDFMMCEAGTLDDDTVSVESEARLGFLGKGKNWGFLMILESNFVYDKGNTDRGVRAGEPTDSGMTGEDFGIEKLDFFYNFSDYGADFAVQTGWNTKFLDWETGALCYVDDHPYIGLKGEFNNISWEGLYSIVYDNPGSSPLGTADADELDWDLYTFKMMFPYKGMKISPFYAYSDNQAREAKVSYLGFQAFGQIGKLRPRAEFVYAFGDRDDLPVGDTIVDADVSAFAGFAALEFNLSTFLNPYVGGYYISGDDDAYDDDIDAFNPITNAAQYTSTFGMNSGFCYQYVPALGSHIYSNDTSMLGENGGYGGLSNSARAESPGMYSIGLGCKGRRGKLSYKTQIQYICLEETGALEDVMGIEDIDDELGYQFDLQLTFHFSDHFSLGNTISVYEPGDAIEDMYGHGFDDTGIMDTIEMMWKF